jgi:hypothetical protein
MIKINDEEEEKKNSWIWIFPERGGERDFPSILNIGGMQLRGCALGAPGEAELRTFYARSYRRLPYRSL